MPPQPYNNSCHNRHCPKCPAVAQAKWIAGRLERVLPTRYFHVVFTSPSELRAIARGNPVLVYDLLFRSAAATLLELGRDTNRLGGELGVTTVLHTWSRDLSYPPHVHGVVTGGALSLDGERWLSARDDYLFTSTPLGIIAHLERRVAASAHRGPRTALLLDTGVSQMNNHHARMHRLGSPHHAHERQWIEFRR